MDERVVQFRVGVMIIAVLIVAVILVVLFSQGKALLRSGYTVHMKFPDAPGVTKGTPIKKSGILIGRVTKVDLEDDNQVSVVARIESGYHIRRSEVARISSSLLGDSVIQIAKGAKPVANGRGNEAVEPDGEVRGELYSDPLQVIGNLEGRLADALSSVAHTSDELGKLASRIDNTLADKQEKIRSIIDQTEQMVGTFRSTAANINEVFGDPQTRARLKETADVFPDLLRETRTTVGQLSSTLGSLSKFTDALGENAPTMFSDLGTSARKLGGLVEQLDALAQSINRGEGTIGQLMKNPQLYRNLSRAAENVEELSQMLRPIVNDVRVFTDKIARHPESLGVRGALKPGDGTKWGGDSGASAPQTLVPYGGYQR